MKTKLSSCALFAFTAALGSPPVDALQGVMAAMDQAAGQFQAMSAKVRYVSHLAVIDDDTVETGTVMMEKVRPGEVAGRIDFLPPNQRSVVFEQRRVQVYTPKTKTVQIYDLGKHGDQLDRFLMLGFGTSGGELARDYTVRLLGNENIGDRPATKLELVPKTKEMLDLVTKIELWMGDPSAFYPWQEKIYEKSGDYRLSTYSDLQINPKLKPDAWKLKLPNGVTTQYPQKQ